MYFHAISHTQINAEHCTLSIVCTKTMRSLEENTHAVFSSHSALRNILCLPSQFLKRWTSNRPSTQSSFSPALDHLSAITRHLWWRSLNIKNCWEEKTCKQKRPSWPSRWTDEHCSNSVTNTIHKGCLHHCATTATSSQHKLTLWPAAPPLFLTLSHPLGRWRTSTDLSTRCSSSRFNVIPSVEFTGWIFWISPMGINKDSIHNTQDVSLLLATPNWADGSVASHSAVNLTAKDSFDLNVPLAAQRSVCSGVLDAVRIFFLF